MNSKEVIKNLERLRAEIDNDKFYIAFRKDCIEAINYAISVLRTEDIPAWRDGFAMGKSVGRENALCDIARYIDEEIHRKKDDV